MIWQKIFTAGRNITEGATVEIVSALIPQQKKKMDSKIKDFYGVVVVVVGVFYIYFFVIILRYTQFITSGLEYLF